MTETLTEKQELAARLHANGVSKAAALREVGYAESTSTKSQSRIFGKPPMLEAVNRFRCQLFEEFEKKGLTPERIAEALVKQLDVNPLPAIALWLKIVERTQLHQDATEFTNQLGSILAEEFMKARRGIVGNQNYDLAASLMPRIQALANEWARQWRR